MAEKYDFSNMFVNAEIKPIPNLQEKEVIVMASCYDCIHCGACSDARDSGFSALEEDASECIHYKNKEDVSEVVRCKDCKYRRELDCPMYHEELEDCDDGDYVYTDIVATDNTVDDGFCHRGEKN